MCVAYLIESNGVVRALSKLSSLALLASKLRPLVPPPPFTMPFILLAGFAVDGFVDADDVETVS